MAKYVIRKMHKGMGDGAETLYPKLVSDDCVGLGAVATIIEERCSLRQSDVKAVLTEFVETLKSALSDGRGVRIEGLGTFRTMLGVNDKEDERVWKDSIGRGTSARNISVKTVNFKPDKRLIEYVGKNIVLERLGGVSPTDGAVNTGVDERKAKAVEYIKANGFIRTSDYVELTGLSHSAALKELNTFAADADSGIKANGQRSSKVFVITEG